jgi:hypothetical protein
LTAESIVNMTEKEHENGTLAANKVNQLVSDGIKEALPEAVAHALEIWKKQDAQNIAGGPKAWTKPKKQGTQDLTDSKSEESSELHTNALKNTAATRAKAKPQKQQKPKPRKRRRRKPK